MPKWKEGFRTLSEDIKTLRAWAWALSIVGAAMITAVWYGWAYWSGMPPPVLALGAVAMFIMLFVTLYVAALAGHRYFGIPIANPRLLLSSNPDSPSSRGVDRVQWTSKAERQAKLAKSQPPSAAVIPDGEFNIGHKRDKQGRLYVVLENCQDEPKTKYNLRLVELRIWSGKLNAGSGGFARYPPFIDRAKPVELTESGGSHGRLEHIDPKRFELIINQASKPWLVRDRDGSEVLLKDGVWQFTVELHWNGGVSPITHHIRLVSDKLTKTADFVSAEMPNA